MENLQEIEQPDYQFTVSDWQFYDDKKPRKYLLATGLPQDPEKLAAFVENLLTQAWKVYSEKVDTSYREYFNPFDPKVIIEELKNQNYFKVYSMGEIPLMDIMGRLKLETDGEKVRCGFYFIHNHFNVTDLEKLLALFGGETEVS